MPALALAFASMLVDICSTLIGRAVLALGIEFVTYNGLGLAFDGLESSIVANLNSLPSTAFAFASAIGIFKAINIIFGAVTARIAISGVRNGSFTRMLTKS